MQHNTHIYDCQSIVTNQQLNQDERRQRKRNLIYLIHQYLGDYSLTKTQKALQEEYKCDEFQVCDNIDLDAIYLEYCSLFQIKFGKKPKVLKRSDNGVIGNGRNHLHGARIKNRDGVIVKKEENASPIKDMEGVLTISSSSMPGRSLESSLNNERNEELKAPVINYSAFPEEWKEIVDNISRMIVQEKFDTTWSNVQGSHLAKNVLRESVILPLQRPDLFKTIRPWRSVLLHGPPGNGKTLMAKALAEEGHGRVTFFNVQSSSITSKWRGESEKYIRVLFEVAKQCSPSIIFIDEIEGLTTSRDSATDYEASRRVKNELLTLMDGLESNVYSGVFLLCNTNLPWLIDEAFLRRFEQKIIIPLPNLDDHIAMIKQYIPATRTWPEEKVGELAMLVDGFTGDDVRLVAKQMEMIQIRKALHRSDGGFMISPGETVTFSELKETIMMFRSNARALLQKHVEWNRKYGSYDVLV